MKRQVPDGAVVKFHHRRVYDDRTVLVVEPRGGTTICRLEIPDEEAIEATARCNSKENYCKRIGRDVSLGRALLLAEKMYPDLFKQEVKDERAVRS